MRVDPPARAGRLRRLDENKMLNATKRHSFICCVLCVAIYIKCVATVRPRDIALLGRFLPRLSGRFIAAFFLRKIRKFRCPEALDLRCGHLTPR